MPGQLLGGAFLIHGTQWTGRCPHQLGWLKRVSGVNLGILFHRWSGLGLQLVHPILAKGDRNAIGTVHSVCFKSRTPNLRASIRTK